MKKLLCLLLLLASPAMAQQTKPDALPGGVYNSVAPTLAPGQTQVLQLDVNGNLKTSGGGGGGTASYVGSYNFGPNATTLTTSTTAYAAGQSIGGLLTIPVFRTTTGPHALLSNIQILSKGGSTVAKTVYLFTKLPTSTCTNQTALTFAAADAAYLVPGFPVVLSPGIVGSGTTATIGQQAGSYSANNQDTTATVNLYACVVEGAADTPTTTSDLVLSIGGIND